MRIDKTADTFLLQLHADGRSDHTVRQYRRHLRLMARWAADVAAPCDLGVWTHEHLAAFLASPQARTRPDGGVKKETTIDCLRSSIRTFFSFLHKSGQLSKNPAIVVRRSVTSRSQPRGLTEDEEKRLRAALAEAQGPVEERDRVLFLLMLGTGIRLGSALALDRQDLDLNEGLITVRHAKRGASYDVFLNRDLCDLMTQYLGAHDGDRLFPGESDQQLSPRSVQRRFKVWCDRAALRTGLSPHSLRHTAAMRMYAQTGDVLIVKEALGHQSIASTVAYARPTRSQVREAMLAS